MTVSRYKKELDFSYALGITITIELLKRKPQLIRKVYMQTQTKNSPSLELVISLCQKYNIKIEKNDKAFNILSPKDNCYLIAEFNKDNQLINREENHIVLVNPSNAGNLGTIIRTMVGFNIVNLIIIRPAVDVYDPKVIRSSMGSLFHINIQYFESFDEYYKIYHHHLYCLMLKGKKKLKDVIFQKPWALVFGNEAKGLDDSFLEKGTSVVIPHSSNIDSLNLPVAFSLALYTITIEDF